MLYAIILLIALVLHKEDSKTILLALVVAFTHYIPTSEITNSDMWYLVCVLAECTVIIVSLRILTTSSLLLIPVTAILLSAHLSSYFSTEMYEYSFVAVTLGYAQILCFIGAAPIVISSLSKLLNNSLNKIRKRMYNV